FAPLVARPQTRVKAGRNLALTRKGQIGYGDKDGREEREKNYRGGARPQCSVAAGRRFLDCGRHIRLPRRSWNRPFYQRSHQTGLSSFLDTATVCSLLARKRDR